MEGGDGGGEQWEGNSDGEEEPSRRAARADEEDFWGGDR